MPLTDMPNLDWLKTEEHAYLRKEPWRETVEEVLGEYGFVVAWLVQDHWANLWVFNVMGRSDRDNQPTFEHFDEKGMQQFVQRIEQADLYLNGFVKWDGCSEFDFARLHFCGAPDYKNCIALLEHLYRRAFELMGRAQEPEWGETFYEHLLQTTNPDAIKKDERAVLFLDIDGVLTTEDTRFRTADPACVDHLNRLLRLTNAQIVVSSSWRREGLDAVRKQIQAWGVEGEVVDVTPDLARQSPSGLYLDVSRGVEIAAWLTEHPTQHFVILDDDTDLGALAPRAVRTETRMGLQGEDVRKAIDILDARRSVSPAAPANLLSPRGEVAQAVTGA